MTAAGYTVSDELWLWWLADPAQPRLIGSLRNIRRSAAQAGGVSLQYCPAWLAHGLALSEDLPLRAGEFLPTQADSAAGAVDDARPDRWGERVIRLIDRPARLTTLEYLYFAGAERFGALGVSVAADAYRPCERGPLVAIDSLQSVHDLLRRVEAGEPVPQAQRRLIAPGATLGGARPKALLSIKGVPWIVKFSEAGEPTDSAMVEHASLGLAAKAGIAVCKSQTLGLAKGHALAIARFDRRGAQRLHALSAHVALRAAGQAMGYPELALLLRRRGPADAFAAQGEQLFRRLLFNIFIDNTDDHEKNHALLVADDQRYHLSPAFDVLPSGQALGYQQMRVGRDGAESTLDNALSEHRAFALTLPRALEVARDVATVTSRWREHFAAAGVAAADIDLLAGQIDRPHLQEQRRQASAPSPG